MHFFKNGLRCKLHYHGASCSIDAMLDTYYYGVHKLDSRLHNDKNQLLNKLSEVSLERDHTQSVSCSMRENTWNWCVKNLSDAFAPKGTNKAEILPAFIAMTKESGKRFVSKYADSKTCSHCGAMSRSTTDIDMCIPHLQTVNEKVNGSIQKGVELTLASLVDSSVNGACKACQKPLTVLEYSFEMSDFLVVHIGLHGMKNVQTPAVELLETMTIHNVRYVLSAVVQMRQEHFYTVVKDRGCYTVLDDLAEQEYRYPNLYSAITKQMVNQYYKVNLNQMHDGVHILVYAKESLLAKRHDRLTKEKVEGPNLSPGSLPRQSESASQVPNMTLNQDKQKKDTWTKVSCRKRKSVNSDPDSSEPALKQCRLKQTAQSEFTEGIFCKGKYDVLGDTLDVENRDSLDGASSNSTRIEPVKQKRKAKSSSKAEKNSSKRPLYDVKYYDIFGSRLRYIELEAQIYLSCQDAFTLTGQMTSISKRGFT